MQRSNLGKKLILAKLYNFKILKKKFFLINLGLTGFGSWILELQKPMSNPLQNFIKTLILPDFQRITVAVGRLWHIEGK